MKRLLVAAGFMLAATAVQAQEGPAPSAPATSRQQAEAGAVDFGRADTAYQGRRHRYPGQGGGKHAGDPPVIDHSMDRLIVQPTHSSITLIEISPLIGVR